jgi:hypothetical protein
MLTPHLVRRRSVLAMAVALAAAGTTLLSPAAPAHADSELGGAITRSEVIQRAQYWVDEHVPYSQDHNDAYKDGDGHTYRPDCSGYVSMAWHLTQPAGWGTDRDTEAFQTWTGKTFLDSYSELKPGDALLSSGHIVIFDKWTDSTRTAMMIYQEPTWGRFAEHKKQTVAYYKNSGFKPLRYNKIVDGAVPAADAHGPLWGRNRSAAGVWEAHASQIDSNAGLSDAASVSLPDGTLHVFTVLPGSGVWYRSRSASGTWAASATKIDANGDIRAISAAGLANGTIHVQTVVPGSGVWDRTRSATGTWASSVKIDDNGSIAKVSSSGLGDGTLHVQTLVPDAGVWDRTRSATGTWAAHSAQIDDNDFITDISAAPLANGGVQFFAVVPESGVWTRAATATGGWQSSATKVDDNGSIDEVAAAGLPNGSVQLNTVVNGSGIWNRTRSAGGAWDAHATQIDTNGKIFAVYTTGLPNGSTHVGALVNTA